MKRLIISLAALAVLASACGSSPATETSATTLAPTTAAPTVTEAPAPDEAAVPLRIVSLSPTATEILFAIGAGSQVVAVDSMSNYPDDAPATDLSAYQPNVEAIAGFEPDLVVTSYDPGDLVAGLDAIGVATLLQGSGSSLGDTYAQIEELGAVTGHEQEAIDLVAEMRAELQDLVASAPSGAGITYFHEIDSTLFTATSSTFIGEIYAMFGLENIADAADADGSSFGYPQLSNEYIIDADPSVIFLADSLYSGEDADTVAARAGWETISAVSNGNVVIINDDIASRWSPRVVELAAAIAAAIEKASVPA